MINLNTQTRQTDSTLPFITLSQDALFLPLNITTSKTTGKIYASGIKATQVNLPSPEPSASSTPQPSEVAGAFSNAKFNYGVIEMNAIPNSFADEQAQADYLRGSASRVCAARPLPHCSAFYVAVGRCRRNLLQHDTISSSSRNLSPESSSVD